MDRAGMLQFQNKVWEIVRTVPAGTVITYGQIAALIPLPAGVAESTYKAFAARWVGGAMAACPESVPWQRVVNAQGQISTRAGAEKQRRLLESEGIVFDEKGRINLKRFGWNRQATLF